METSGGSRFCQEERRAGAEEGGGGGGPFQYMA